ncbi:unnamed protein product [Durusdinium trenchii]|uniref:Uncharacterized protein n=1 Tax=Durusdinium trenchii TaxID=1381693 RepID=A0ABP0ND69_9DINO
MGDFQIPSSDLCCVASACFFLSNGYDMMLANQCRQLLGRKARRSQPITEALEVDNVAEHKVAILCTHDCAPSHQREIEMLSGARALNGDHIFTSASVPANAAVIKGVLKHGRPEQLTVLLPQTLDQQDPKFRRLLDTCVDAGASVVSGTTSISKDFDEAAHKCHRTLLNKIDQLVAFAPMENGSDTLVATAREQGVKTTTFYT